MSSQEDAPPEGRYVIHLNPRRYIHLREQKIRVRVADGTINAAMLESVIHDLDAQPDSEASVSVTVSNVLELKVYFKCKGLSKEDAKRFLLSMLNYRKVIDNELAEKLIETRSRGQLPTSAIRTKVSHMSCYLCAYNSSKKPQKQHPLPTGSSVGSNDDIGGCSKCSVWACSNHGTRYGKFECAICTSATAAASAMVAGAVGGSAASLAYAVGRNASEPMRRQARVAMERVVEDSRRPAQQIDARSLVAPNQGLPNLVTNLADAIRQEFATDAGPIRAVQEEGQGFGIISLDAIGGAVRERFADTELLEPSDDAVTTVTGALLLGYDLADAGTAAPRDDPSFRWPEDVVRLPRPWRITHPILLDPVLWMLGTALPEG
jgi:hypothetical protein